MNDLTAVHQQLDMLALKVASEAQEYVPDAVVFKQPHDRAALGLSIATAGIDYQVICKQLDISPGVWTRIINTGTAQFPPGKIGLLQKLVTNDIYIRWLANQCDLDVVTRKSSLEEQLQQKDLRIKELEHDEIIYKDLIKGSRG